MRRQVRWARVSSMLETSQTSPSQVGMAAGLPPSKKSKAPERGRVLEGLWGGGGGVWGGRGGWGGGGGAGRVVWRVGGWGGGRRWGGGERSTGPGEALAAVMKGSRVVFVTRAIRSLIFAGEAAA